MDDKDEEKREETENENLRELILQQFANLESSETSDDDSYKVRLSCILEDDESESSGAAAKDFPKDVEKERKPNKESEKGPPEAPAEVPSDSEISEEFAGGGVQITDLDDVTLCERENTSEEANDEPEKGFAIKKLKSSDNVHRRPVVVRRRELSSDSSDLDISGTNSAEGPPGDLKIVEVTEADEENTLAPDNAYAESETSAEEDLEGRPPREGGEGMELEALDYETLAPIFAKVSRTYLEKTKSNVKWEENEKIEKVFKEFVEEAVKKKAGLQPGEQLSLQDVHIRGITAKQYDPPVPPETYLWEELKRLRERGGYPWTYLDKPPFDEATWKKYMRSFAGFHYAEATRRSGRLLDSMKKSELRKGRSSESLEQSPKEGAERGRRREKSLPPSRDRKAASRESSISSIGREVRCACQYYQSDKLLPERISLFGSRPPSGDLEMSKSSGEHVYEPINPPPLATERKQEAADVQQLRGSSIPESVKPVARVPSKASLTRKESTEESKTSEEMPSEGAQELQDRLESRFLAPTPTATSDTTASQSKTDVTSTVLDTSEFEDLPVKQGSLVKTRREQMRAQAAEIQQRLRNHAGRIRNKFSNMPRPGLARKDRPKRETHSEKVAGRFKLPEMHAPKISLPDRSKFKFPEKAKLHLPESSRFHLPDRSKFHLPEGPKLRNLAERARSHLPEKRKFHLPDRSKFHLPEKAKLHLPDKSKFHLPEKAKFNLPNRPKLELPSFKRAAASSETSPGKSRFEFDLKSYPKLFSKHSKDYITSSPKQTRGRTPPPRMQEAPQPRKWKEKLDELKYADDEADEARETDSRKSESLFDKDGGYLEDLEKVPTLSTKSSTSRLSELSDDRKKGVLEEINPDEFFLRQKGISQDDIDIGQYLSREIREAFRSPDVNALAKMDYMDVDDENVDPRRTHKRPTVGGAGKTKSILKKTSTSDPSLSEDGYKTYPPRRPGRKSRSQSKSLLNEGAIVAETSPRYEAADVDVSRYENDEVNLSRYDNVEYDEDDVSEYYKTPGPAREYQHYKVPRPHAPVCPSPPLKRKSSAEDEESHKRVHKGWDEDVVDLSEPPKPMARKKHRKKASESVQQQEVQGPPSAELESFAEEEVPQEVGVPTLEIIREPEEVVPELPTESPVPPKRTRTRSSGSRSLRSLAMESDVNRSFRSEPCRDRLDELEDEIIQQEIQAVEESPLVMSAEFAPPRSYNYEVTDLDDPGFGYATVGKPTVAKPQRHKKPSRPPPPRRKKEVSVPVYNTYPRRTPVRPMRNYSTLGPSRPPRQKKIPPIEKTLAERQSRTYAEIKGQFDESLDMIEVSESNKDLQTEKVIEKMKGRPLPPPPRPPRQKSKGPEDELEPTEDEKLSLSILRDDEFPLERRVTAFVHEPPPQGQTVEETCTATQTDPLPDDFSFGTEESDMMPEFSHEQLRIQQAFLEEMKKEEEELRRKGADENDLVDAELKAEVIRQIEDIIAEEKRILERKNGDRVRRETSEHEIQSEEDRKHKSYLDVDADMGYASLERRGHRQELPAAELPKKVEKLQVKELQVDSLNVREVQSDQIFVKELQGNRIASPEIDNRGGTAALGEIDIPPSFIEQVVAKIPWDTLRQHQDSAPQQEPLPPVRPQRRQRASQFLEDSDDEAPFQPRKTHRRHHKAQYSTDEEDRRAGRRPQPPGEAPGIPELGLQLARACTSAGARALKTFAQSNASFARSLDRELCVQAILCIAVALVAGFFLFGFDAKVVHMHRWDFQFPPQPPHTGF